MAEPSTSVPPIAAGIVSAITLLLSFITIAIGAPNSIALAFVGSAVVQLRGRRTLPTGERLDWATSVALDRRPILWKDVGTELAGLVFLGGLMALITWFGWEEWRRLSRELWKAVALVGLQAFLGCVAGFFVYSTVQRLRYHQTLGRLTS